ncbi:DMT family transporter [Kutzneria kofuensis]|uniref:Drug/metabolite transporter (DMT)-like permease n=1 Tax=Kutzneria kofuensis TaxID=103725 RepID=A0A7W9NI77_9PSEU|nr:EamA family transporter [Kutzneria kofuensis]MBB5893334.1 drug/metabolite transporter (DMT)-like permease [Kutzneria kofuensis]
MTTPASLLRLVSLALIWGSSFLWIKLGLDALSPSQMVFARVLLGALVLCAIAFARRTPLPSGRQMWGHLVVYVFFANVLPFTLFAIGEQTVDSGLTGVINSTTPLWAVPCTLLFGGVRRLGLNTVIGVVLGFAGVLVIFSPWQATDVNLGGAAVCLVAAASYGVGVVYAGRFLANKGVAPGALAAAQMLTATAMSALVLPFDGLQPIHFDVPALLAVVVLGVFGTGFAFLIQQSQIAKEGPTAASMVAYLLPVVSVLLGVVFLHETLSWREVAGMAIVLVGVGLTRRKAKVTASEPAKELQPETV